MDFVHKNKEVWYIKDYLAKELKYRYIFGAILIYSTQMMYRITMWQLERVPWCWAIYYMGLHQIGMCFCYGLFVALTENGYYAANAIFYTYLNVAACYFVLGRILSDPGDIINTIKGKVWGAA